jgi:hypothetical protein
MVLFFFDFGLDVQDQKTMVPKEFGLKGELKDFTGLVEVVQGITEVDHVFNVPWFDIVGPLKIGQRFFWMGIFQGESHVIIK